MLELTYLGSEHTRSFLHLYIDLVVDAYLRFIIISSTPLETTYHSDALLVAMAVMPCCVCDRLVVRNGGG